MNKTKKNAEIDLIEIFILVFKNKTKILLIIILSVVLMLIHILTFSKTTEPRYITKTLIKPISTFEEFNYQVYNNFLKSYKVDSINYPLKVNDDTFILKEIELDINQGQFIEINKNYLMNLFIEIMNEKNFIRETIKNSKYLNESDFVNKFEFEKKVSELAKSIQIIPYYSEVKSSNKNFITDDLWEIIFETGEIDNWNNFLSFLEASANEEVRRYLNSAFQDLVVIQQRMKKYMLEDLDEEIAGITEPYIKERLLLNKSKLENEKNIMRLENAFNVTPIADPNRFYAAKIMLESTIYNNVSEKQSASDLSKILLSIIFGLLFGIIYVLISNAILKKQKINI